ncbi:hypothetical protein VP1G_08904 [Cytospora mali]|uniref:Uncharacterized protein n=1 Tax=Cytospora mali TaxID=578113 RepID=A0A194VCN2_CYTMA|nr:hypothetical protein VP1G_08904 [Valsa mali var. pyri (nom. inval.)]
MTGGKWKKALLPSLGSRRKDHGSISRNSASKTGLPSKSLKRKLQTVTRDFSGLSPRRIPDGLLRPLPKSQSSHLLGGETHRMSLSPSMSPGKLTGYRICNGSSRKGKGDGDAERISHSVTSVLAGANDLDGSAADSIESTAASRMARFKKNKMFAKFAGVVSEHFSAKGSLQEVKLGGTTTVSSDRPMKPITHGLPLGRLTLAQLPLPDIEASGTIMEDRFIEDNGVEKLKGQCLTLLDEVSFQNGQPLDDPFSEFSPDHLSTEFDARLKSVQGPGVATQHESNTSVSDPFLAERILDTSANSILRTPPVGCSTPRTRSRSSVSCKSPTKDHQAPPNPSTEALLVSTGGPLTIPQRRRKTAIICESPTRISTSLGTKQNESGSGDITGSLSRANESFDSTRLSSYPPGSTIRHVPRSIGRLTKVPDLSMPSTMRRKSPPVGRKKHPSPSKGQLDLYGKFIEKNLALGVYKDPDELAMDFDSPKSTRSPALYPRDKNRLMRGSAASNIDLRKNYNSQGLCPGLSTHTRSRIPQPVRQLSRSRTESAFARDFLPASHDDLTEDELQWDSSAYKVGRGRGSRCHHCGSMAEDGV